MREKEARLTENKAREAEKEGREAKERRQKKLLDLKTIRDGCRGKELGKGGEE